LAQFEGAPYEIGSEVERPDAILLRSADLHESSVGPEVRAVGRAGIGVNNIPIEAMSRRGIPVFNTRAPTPTRSRNLSWPVFCSPRET
jgi:D-3-phosphoglycerate dehydrogenase